MVRISERRACGQRRTYNAGCRCFRCRKAEADYRRQLRAQLCRGKLPLGCRVNARATWRLITALTKAGYRKAQIAACLGLKRRRLEVHPESVAWGTQLRVQDAYATLTAESDG